MSCQQMVETQYNGTQSDVSQSNFNHKTVVPSSAKPPIIRKQKQSLPIDESYEKWSRFENFLKFAEKKEVRDRLKELDPPPLSNYVDPGTIESINKARKNPANLVKKSNGTKDPELEKKQNLDNNKKRIAKMKKMYSMFLKMEKNENGEESSNMEDQLDDDSVTEDKNHNNLPTQHSNQDNSMMPMMQAQQAQMLMNQ